MKHSNSSTLKNDSVKDDAETNIAEENDSPTDNKKVPNKSITCEEPEYLKTMINARTEVIIALNTEKKIEQQIDDLKIILEEKKKLNNPIKDEYIEMCKRRYTIEYIDSMIESSNELYIEKKLKGIKQKIIDKGYTYETIEILVMFDEVLTSIINNIERKNQFHVTEEEDQTAKYKKSIFTKLYSSLVGGDKNEHV